MSSSQSAAMLTLGRRTRAFFWLQVATLTSEFLGPPLGSLLMAKIGPYFGFLSGTVLMAMGSFLLLLLPSKTARSRQSKAPMSGNAVLDDVPTDVSTDDIEVPKKPESFVTRLSGHFHHGLVAMLSNKRLLVSIATMVVSKLTRPLLELTMQYMSVKFGWTISQVCNNVTTPSYQLLISSIGKRCSFHPRGRANSFICGYSSTHKLLAYTKRRAWHRPGHCACQSFNYSVRVKLGSDGPCANSTEFYSR